MAFALAWLLCSLFVLPTSAEDLSGISGFFQRGTDNLALSRLQAPPPEADDSPTPDSSERLRSTCRGCACYKRWMGQDFPGLNFCTDHNTAWESAAGKTPNMMCMVADSKCEGKAEGACEPNCPRYTTNGCVCERAWTMEGHGECQDSCCNPTNAEAEWCMVTDPSCQGMQWGPCAPGPVRHPKERVTRKGCKCANGWNVQVDGEVQHCHTFCCNPSGLGVEGDVCVVEDEACEGMNIGRCRP
ncbi:unnamed protein product [Symbiodinium pilosum]|uniref:Uncharacterized protein n=1 Tax=Symbiodinium pilosum TaxID=2952 RepID=A0A812XUH4_SYMPI|nr:unnamed protein product [Symbiodinium pilosum]